MKKKKAQVRLTHVSNVIELSPHLRRISVTGESLQDFPSAMEGGYVKVVLQSAGDSEVKMRSYTIRAFNPQSNELSLDFVVNRHNGPATNWARQAKVGDSVGIAGPGPMKMTDYDHHSYLLVADLTSINAINGYMPRFKKNADARDSKVFLALEAGSIRALRPILQKELGFERLNIFTVGYWKKGVDADRFGAQKKANPL